MSQTNDKMADGLCSESDRKHFVATVINENVFSASEKSGKCVNLALANRVQSVSGESQRGETVKTRMNRGQQYATATGQQQQPQQSKKVLDAKLIKNKSAPSVGQGIVGPQPQSGSGITTTHVVGPASVPTCGGGGVVSATTNNKSQPPPRALVESEKKIVPSQKVMNVVLQTTVGASAGNGLKMQQKKDLKSASSAANVDMAANKKSVSEPEQQQQKQYQKQKQSQQDTDDSSSAKKKRCSDRYDSSESSDSGVATLSCTDSSTASSDASDPGSPYSPVSLGEDANQSSTKANMPPQMLSITRQSHRVHHSHQSHHQMTATASTPTHQNTTNIAATTHHHPLHHQQSQMQHSTTTTVQHQWPWNVSSNNNTISNHNNNSSTNNNNFVANASNKSGNSNSSVNSVLSGNSNANTKSKRNSTANSSDINGTAKKVRSSAASVDRLQSQAGLTAAASKRLKVQQEESPSQTKITGYFKSQMKPLKTPLKGDLGRSVTIDSQSCLVSTTTSALEKYLNASGNKTLSKVVIFGAKDEKDLNCQRNRTIAIKKDFFDLPPLTQTMPPSLKKIERKPGAKVAQVAPISRKTAVTQQLKSPKKHIAIAPRTTESGPTPLQKPPTPNAFQIDQTKISQPTVLLTAIRIPPQAGTAPQHTVSTSGTMPPAGTSKAPLTPTKMGSMLQIPVVPNLVQIPNLLATNSPNLLMNNGQLTRMGNGGQYFLNGTLLKLQQISNGHSVAPNTTNGVLSVDSSTLQGNILVKSPTAISQPLPMVAPSTPQKAPTLAMQQSMMSQPSMNGNGCHQAFIAASNQRIPTQPVLMATSTGWYVLNQHTADPISNNIPHQATLTTAMVCKSTRTAVTSITNGVSPPVPPLVTLTSKLESTPVSGPKVSNLSTPKSPTPIPTELKDKAPSPTIFIESAKPLTVECPPLDLPIEAVCPIPIEARIKLESPNIVKDLSKLLQSPKIIAVDDVEIKADTFAPAATSPKCAISPILSQPKTIRFPVPSGCEAGYRFGPKGIKRPDGVCFWDKCTAKYDTNSKLLDHLQTQHVNSQTGPFSCLWSGCKVRGRESCSRRWLERHVLSHGGTKPFKCIVDGCGLRLGSQLALQKHVNGHFNATETKDNPNKRTSDPPIPKQLRKNVKKLRYRRQPFSARMFDFFDAGIMEGLQHRLMVTGSLATGAKGSVTFHGRTMARRKSPCGISELYVKWSPSEIIPDEWVPESINALTKTITIQSMKYQERIALHKYLDVRSSSSGESMKTVSKMQILPQAMANLSTLFGESVSTVTSSTCLSASSTLSSGGRKQSRKPLKKNQTEPS